MILTVNAGSSSIRLGAYLREEGGALRCIHQAHEKSPIPNDAILRSFLEAPALRGQVCEAIAHRIVHGGGRFSITTLLDDEAIRALEESSELAPLHNPPALRWLAMLRTLIPQAIPHLAIFDTSFFDALPPVASTLPLERSFCLEHGLRRFGFHGIAHQAMSSRFAALHPHLVRGGRIISLQLGSGASAAAIKEGRPLDTSMGFSPLQGLIMATRTGDLDAGILLHLSERLALRGQALEDALYRKAGLLGISGISGDMRALLASDAPEAALAIEMYCYRIRCYIGAYMTVLGGLDAILFGGGVGENSPIIRERILAPLAWLGLSIDPPTNHALIAKEGAFHSPKSPIALWVIPTDEAPLLAQAASSFL